MAGGRETIIMDVYEAVTSRRAVCGILAYDNAALTNDVVPAAALKRERGKAMAQIYRDVAINQMIATVEEAMSHAIDWWGDLPTPMNEAIDKFRVQLGAAIDSVEFVKKALDRTVPETSWKATEQR
jgi:hypothetical protein